MDQTKYVNAYIDNAMSTIHENIALILQLKTQNRLLNDVISEKDLALNNFTIEVQSLRHEVSVLNDLKSQNEELKQHNIGIVNKLSHFETMSNQIIQMKQEIKKRDVQIQDLQSQLAAINIRKSKKVKTEDKKVEINDF